MKKKELNLEAIVDNLNKLEKSKKAEKAAEKPVEKKAEIKEVQKPVEAKKITKEIADQDWKKVGSMLFSRPIHVDDETDPKSLPRRVSNEPAGQLESGLASAPQSQKPPADDSQAKYLPANTDDKGQPYLIQGYQPKRYEDQASQSESSRFRLQQHEHTAMERIEQDALSASTPGSGMRMALEENRASTQKYKNRQSK
ncbi:MAG TPA: hypothetical protein VJC07_01240 [Candidatus Nanoarchaeia archaeon]|nr:hypothetical protein [Candidatus Nanoarchaeia archaeon]